MVCPRCVSAVEKAFTQLSIDWVQVKLGEVILQKELNEKQYLLLQKSLQALGFELLDDAKKQQIEKIKAIIIENIHHLENGKLVFSEIISNELNKEYSQLSKLFSLTESITIEQYIILQKIEKVKELLVYNEMNLSEIASKMGYSSVAHLSTQFKKTTGLTPTLFKNQGLQQRKMLDQIF